MEALSYENAAYETICQIMIANMATFDIEKFKAHRQKTYYTLVKKVSLSQIEDFKSLSEHFQHLNQVANL